ncbi:acyltransferase [Dyella sp. LX-66]|uniref:acyltransferase family protein n=1 Tax=unclassified Dyella TaxID=2634549 RepID=UPI001BE0ED9B|nr:MULTISPECIES: acyltransferase [unclassified Dyella]MBT2115780.1 acyltransferase [Dyella sp. LX-1]MBT2139595.1 acyltransferase [Dyella sp. LX-66]
MAERHKLDWIQALRGVAALLVVVTHARRYLLGTPWQPFVEQYILPAAQGVDLFFMVSGFIMVYTTRHADGSLRYASAFLIKRFARVWPVYAVAVLLWIAFLAATAQPIAPLADILKSLCFLPISTHQPPYLGLPYPIGWTLNYEFYFYVIFGVSILFGSARWLAFSAWLGLTLLLAPWLAAGYISLLAVNDYHFGTALANQITNPMVWEFAGGVLVGLLYQSRLSIPRSWLSDTLIVACIALIVATSWRYTWIHGPIRWGAPLLLMFAVMALTYKNAEPRVPRFLVWLGGLSYSLYLLHYIVFSVVTQFMVLLGWQALTPTWLYAILIVPLPLAAAALSRRYVEDGLAVRVRDGLLVLHGRIFAAPAHGQARTGEV